MLYHFLVLILAISHVQGFIKKSNIQSLPVPPRDVVGDPLILTPFLEKGKYKKAQKLSKVSPAIGNITSYAGLFTVNKECDSNIFFWFFPAQKDPWKEAPLLLWLNGGPGCTSMLGLFEELGPFESYEEGLKKRKYSWNVENNLLIIDQPVGVGYSFTTKKCYPENETAVGEDLYQAVLQFHQLFPNFQTNKFVISGESFAGHYIPALAHTIHNKNPSSKVNINLSAMLIGNGWYDPVSQMDYGNYLYNLGLIDDSQNDVYQKYQQQFTEAVAYGDFDLAEDIQDILTDSLFSQYVGGHVDIYHYVPKPHKEKQNWHYFMQSVDVRKALHVGNLKFQNGNKVAKSLRDDDSKSVRPWVEELLESYPIIFYNGELDIICAYPMQTKFLRSLSWSGQDKYLNANRTKWCVGNEQAGYFKGEHNMYDVLVRAAGHEVPTYQPRWAYALVNSVTYGTSDNPLHALTECKSTTLP